MNHTKSIITTDEVEEWINQYSSVLLARAYALLSVREDAEDVVQEVFLSLCKPGVLFDRRSSVRTWLIAILHNKIADLYRKRYKSVQTSFLSVFDNHGEWIGEHARIDWEDNGHIMNDPEFNKIFMDCINKLPVQWKIIVGEAYFSENSATEICRNLNISSSNYWKILQRSRIQLRKCLDLNWFNA